MATASAARWPQLVSLSPSNLLLLICLCRWPFFWSNWRRCSRRLLVNPFLGRWSQHCCSSRPLHNLLHAHSGLTCRPLACARLLGRRQNWRQRLIVMSIGQDSQTCFHLRRLRGLHRSWPLRLRIHRWLHRKTVLQASQQRQRFATARHWSGPTAETLRQEPPARWKN